MSPDSLHSKLFKECASELSYPLSILFNKSVLPGSLPHAWKFSHASPIYKKGPRDNLLSYRPLNLNPIQCKTVECIICKLLFGLIDDHLLFDESQLGFRPNHSVLNQLLLTYNCVYTGMIRVRLLI